MKIAIVIDSSSGLNPKQVEKLGWHFLPLVIDIDNKEYLDGINLDQDQFYEQSKNKNANIKTGTTPYGIMSEKLTKLAKEYDKVVVYPISKYFSSQYNFLAELKIDNLYVVKSLKLTWLMVLDLLTFERDIANGVDFKVAFEKMNQDYKGKILAFPFTTDAIVRSGRLSPTAAAAARLFKIVPVIKLENGKLEKETIGRNFEKVIIKEFEKLEAKFTNKESYLPIVLHSQNENIDKIVTSLQTKTTKKIITGLLPNVVTVHMGIQGVVVAYIEVGQFLDKIVEIANE
ncbi:DegV family protein [Mesomycoplasma conjunctivae]|uniref:UPF0230 protein MYPU_3590 n=1 Tax=Mesomycoplasma conjunctivae (strain ATCC 25834 / NCTC 10147 / HRC/581) TaxID=572263 RepID=C5J6I1_MESCH|nr:DegV family protein [Mesomycoplasma conjunctivae]CAT05073.1 UPF0230 protein MYPU_3590 [Mesomycoplasma conjunctivae]VEU66270.1 DegV family protein [Mesomycoplasma conjunctivae]